MSKNQIIIVHSKNKIHHSAFPNSVVISVDNLTTEIIAQSDVIYSEGFDTQQPQPQPLEWTIHVFGDEKVFVKEKCEEHAYYNLVNDILIKHGKQRIDRTQIGTLSLFSQKIEFSLENNNFPLLTGKRTPARIVFEELNWFISGSTNVGDLQAKNVNIWNGNSSKEFIASRGLKYQEGDIGPGYSHQWRNFGGTYTSCNERSTDGVDQIALIIDLIKNDPTSRRIILSAWNPLQQEMMCLPPCHVMAQFYVDDGLLSCNVTMRSSDVALGLPFNIASYAFLTIMLASICDLKPGRLILNLGDTHIYLTHIDAMKTLLTRVPFKSSTIKIINKREKIEDFEFSDFEISDYYCHQSIKMDMSI